MRQNAEIQAILSLLHPFFHFSHLPIPSHSSALPTPPLKFAPAWKSSIYFCETFFLFLVDLDNITKAHKSVDGWRLRRRAERIWDQHNFIERMRVFRSVEWVRTLLRLTRLRKILSCDRKGINKMWRGDATLAAEKMARWRKARWLVLSLPFCYFQCWAFTLSFSNSYIYQFYPFAKHSNGPHFL